LDWWWLALFCRLVFGIDVIPSSARGGEAKRHNFDKYGENMPEFLSWQGDFAITSIPYERKNNK
jgi:hypothetical protein